MKVLWLTNTPVGASVHFDIETVSGSWMISLEKLIKQHTTIKLGICFFYNDHDELKFEYDNVTYFPIKNAATSFTKKLHSRIFNTLSDTNIKGLKNAIADFKPDIIQLFGTESGLGEIIKEIKIPVIVHIQGLMNPIYTSWFPNGISKFTLLKNFSFLEVFLKKGLIGIHPKIEKMAKREEAILKSARYFFGRTEWDNRIVTIFNKTRHYYYCPELMRNFFYNYKWEYNDSSTLQLVTTIDATLYKGIEIILETAYLLKKHTNIKFKWNIIGIDENNSLVKAIEKIKNKKFINNEIYFRGRKSGESIITELLQAHIFIHPSHIDNSPNSVCEAMLLGMPVIAGNVGGVRSLIDNNINGILYNSYDPYELAGIISEKNKKSTELIEIGINARRTALVRHDPDTIIQTILNTYDVVIHDHKQLLSCTN